MSPAWPPGRSEDELLDRVYGRARAIRARRRFGAAGVVSALAAATLIPVLAIPANHPSQAINTANQAPNGAVRSPGSGSSHRGGPATSGPVNIGPGGTFPGSSGQAGLGGGTAGGHGSPGTRGDNGSGATTTPAGSVSAGPTTTDLPGPKANSVNPPYGPMSGGTTVTITGTDLSRVTEVLFGTKPARSFTVKSATAIVAVTPAVASPGMVPIGVYNSNHQGNADTTCWTNPLCTDGFLYVPTPPVTATQLLPTGSAPDRSANAGDLRHLIHLP